MWEELFMFKNECLPSVGERSMADRQPDPDDITITKAVLGYLCFADNACATQAKSRALIRKNFYLVNSRRCLQRNDRSADSNADKMLSGGMHRLWEKSHAEWGKYGSRSSHDRLDIGLSLYLSTPVLRNKFNILAYLVFAWSLIPSSPLPTFRELLLVVAMKDCSHQTSNDLGRILCSLHR